MNVSEVMSAQVVRITGDKPVTETAKLMIRSNVGSILVDSDKIVTKGDLVTRVIAQGLDPGLVTTVEISSSPLVTCTPNTSLEEAMLLLAKHGIKRLVIVEENKIIGIVTASDILRAAPGLYAIREESLFTSESEMESFEGYCDNCKNWDLTLQSVGGFMLCSNCREGENIEVEGELDEEGEFY